MANKLELTWYGKEKPIAVEPRLLIENVALSNSGGDPDTENMLIHGDNLLALKALNITTLESHLFNASEPPYKCILMLGSHHYI